MKTAKYEQSPGDLLNLLASRQFVWADLYTFTLSSGQVLRYTNADIDIGYGGTTWAHNQVLLDTSSSRSGAHWKIGLDVDTWQVTVIPRISDPVTGTSFPDKIGAQGWLAAARAGALRGTIVTVDRAYFANWPSFPFVPPATPKGVVEIFAGRVAEVDVTRSMAVVSINSHLELLNVMMPRNLFQAPCRHTLFDVGCQLSAAAFASTGTITAVYSNCLFASPVMPVAGSSGTFALGRVVMTSGNNNTFSRAVRNWSGGPDFQLIAPFPFDLQAGDTFQAYPGCDKSQTACTAFNNLANFGGTPYIPAPETAI